jgi:hypothetical protein
VFNIFSDEPWSGLPRLPDYIPWWGDLVRGIKEMVIPVLRFASPGIAFGIGHWVLAENGRWYSPFAFGLISLVALLGLAYAVETIRMALRQVNVRGHVRLPPR